MDEALARLTDVEVLTLGLVKQGANQKPFFIVKSSDGDVSEGDVASDVANEQGLKDKLWSRFMKYIQKEDDVAENTVDTTEETTEEETTEEEITETTEEETTEEVQQSVAPVNEELAQRLEALVKSHEEMKVKLEKAEKIAADERDQRLVREYLEKADAYNAVGVERAEMGVLLRKADDAGIGTEISGILKAASEAMQQSGIFVEQGSTGRAESTAKTVLLTKTETLAKSIRAADPTKSQAIAFAEAYRQIASEASDVETQAHVAAERRASRRTS